MEPAELGKKYDKIAQWWHDQHEQSSYGVSQLERAIKFCTSGKTGLDVGCGSGGRLIRVLQKHGFAIIGIDVSTEMLNLARKNHPEQEFLHQDISTWDTQEKFDFILAWDSIFHLPLAMQKPVLKKLCGLLNPDGIIIYSFGKDVGEHTDKWCDDTFYYSSLGIQQNVELLINNGMSILHLELDQYPEKHVYTIATKL